MADDLIDHKFFVDMQTQIDSLPPGPERLRYQGILDRLIVKLEELPDRVLAMLVAAGVTDPEAQRAIFTRELEHVVSELPERKSTGN